MVVIAGGSMSKVRVYEVAKQLNLDPKQVVTLFQSLGVADVRNHMSSVEVEAVEREDAARVGRVPAHHPVAVGHGENPLAVGREKHLGLETDALAVHTEPPESVA